MEESKLTTDPWLPTHSGGFSWISPQVYSARLMQDWARNGLDSIKKTNSTQHKQNLRPESQTGCPRKEIPSPPPHLFVCRSICQRTTIGALSAHRTAVSITMPTQWNACRTVWNKLFPCLVPLAPLIIEVLPSVFSWVGFSPISDYPYNEILT